MKSKLLEEIDGLKVFALVLDTGDEVIETLTRFARERRIDAAHFTAIGAFQDVLLAYFDWERKEYEKIPVESQVEVVSLSGDIARDEDGSPKVHAHVVVGRRDGSALAGHLMQARVRPTLEVVLTESSEKLRRRHDERSGLALIDLDAVDAGVASREEAT
jgi:predicted DNA-binding protein with PD1-like motif